jgi:hypothetical protein
MRILIRRMLLALAVAAVATEPLRAQAPSLGQDLAATIALHGKPCDTIVETKRNSDSDYTATCKDGHRYRIYVDSSGHVVVQPL